jgi:hypothetical protein
MLVWGVIGAAMALMFQVFNAGAREVMDQGLLPGKGTPLQTLVNPITIKQTGDYILPINIISDAVALGLLLCGMLARSGRRV